MKDKISQSNRHAFAQLSMMFVLTFAAQLVVLLKSSKTAAIFGVSADMDVYNFINSVATFLFSFLGAGISTVLIPAYAKERFSAKAVNGFITALYGFAFFVLSLFVLLRKPFFKTFTHYSAEYISLACGLIAVIMLSQYFNSVNNIFVSFLQCRNRFNVPKIITILATVGMTSVVYLYTELDIRSYSLANMLFLMLESVALGVYAVNKGFRYRPVLTLRDSEFREMMRVFWPTVLGSGVYQVTLLTDSLISSSLGTGNLSALTYANTISGMLNTIICANVVSYIYPKMASEKDTRICKKKLFQYLTFFAFIMCGLVIAFFAGGHDAVRILFEHGKFSADSTDTVFICVLIYLIGFPVNIMRDVIYRYFYSQKNTKSPFFNGLSASILNIAVSILLSRFWGIYGIVLGTTVTAVFSLTSILVRFKREYDFEGNFMPYLKEMIKLLVASGTACFICAICKTYIPLNSSLLVSVITAVISLAAYIGILVMLHSTFHKVEF